MPTLTITKMANGWTLTPRPVASDTDAETRVARTTKELSALVEDWAKKSGTPSVTEVKKATAR